MVFASTKNASIFDKKGLIPNNLDNALNIINQFKRKLQLRSFLFLEKNQKLGCKKNKKMLYYNCTWIRVQKHLSILGKELILSKFLNQKI